MNLITTNLTESMVTSPNGFNQMSLSIKQIYGLLEQSNLDKIKKDKPSNRLEPKQRLHDEESKDV